MDSKLNRQVSGVSSHTGKKRHHHKTNHSQSKPVNNLESHPLFQRRVSRLHERKKRRNYFSWLQAVPDAFATIGKYLLPKKKQTDPNAPVLGVREIEQLRILSFSGSERRKLLFLFREMTGEKRNTASFRAFTRYFRLAPDVWAMRTFEIMNYQLSGAVSFLEFATFLVKYLVVDRASTEEFCFRLLSRRGITFMPEHSILDLEDFVTIVTFRYKEFSTLPVQKKVALDIFSFVDADNDGGISVHEFRSFSAKNPVLLRMAHFLLNHLRKCIFGIDFWVEKSRIWKAKQPHSGVSLSLAHNRNAESELFYGQVLKEPVVDAAGAPLTNDFYIKLYEAKKRAEDEQRQRLVQQQELHAIMSAQNSLLGTNDSQSLDNQNDAYTSKAPSLGSLDRSMSQSMMSLGNNSTYNNSVVSLHSQQRQGSRAMSREESFADSIDSQQKLNLGQQGVQMLLTTGVDTQTMLAQQKDYRTLNAFKAPYSLQKLLDHVTFAQDFPEIIKYRQEKRRERRQQEQLRREHIIQMKREAYVKLIKVCSDFVNRRRDIRYAFDTWLRVTGKESHAEVNAPHRSDLHRVDENLPADLLSLDEAGIDTDLAQGAELYYGLSSDGMSSKDDLESVTLSSLGDHRSHPHKKHHHKQHQVHHAASRSPKASSNNPVEQVVMLGDANNAMDRNSNISALSNDFFHHQSSMLSSSSLLGDEFDQNSIASGGHVPADWTPTAAQLPPLPTSPIANSNFHDPYDKNRRSFFPESLKPAAISISSASSVSKHLQAAPSDSCPVSPVATSNTPYFTSSPFLDNPIARKQQLIQEEIQRAFHPQRYTGRISDMHRRIVEDNDIHFAEKEVDAVDSFVEEYLNSRFFVPSKAEGRKAHLPPPKPKSLESVESVFVAKKTQQQHQRQASVSLSKTLPPPNLVTSSPLAAASSLLLVKKKPLPNAGSTLDTKILFLQQRATQAQKVLMSLDGEETIDV